MITYTMDAEFAAARAYCDGEHAFASLMEIDAIRRRKRLRKMARAWRLGKCTRSDIEYESAVARAVERRAMEVRADAAAYLNDVARRRLPFIAMRSALSVARAVMNIPRMLSIMKQ